MLSIIRDPDSLLTCLQNRQQEISAYFPVVSKILDQIKTGGDRAIRQLTLEFDHVDVQELKISSDQLQRAEQVIDSNLRSVILEAGNNIRAFHKSQLPKGYTMTQTDGTNLSYRWRPIERVGVYIPGGSYPLFSTVLMNVIPAQIAGVRQIVICTPPLNNGRPSDTILAVCSLLGITDVFRVGGVQAIAAMAYGTESIAAVDKITGPGNIYVTVAKQIVSSLVGIDMIAGPTELVIIADKSANPRKIATDLYSQAEHDPQALPILLTDSESIIVEVNRTLQTFLEDLTTSDIAKKSLFNRGFIYSGPSIEECVYIAKKIAPEHVSLQLNEPEKWIDGLIAGTIFMGSETPVAWGDYWAGANHILPTSGQARFKGPLSVQDFMVPYAVIEANVKAINNSGAKVIKMAREEGLSGHAESILLRRTND
jgi:histidinol dehydrogenase